MNLMWPASERCFYMYARATRNLLRNYTYFLLLPRSHALRNPLRRYTYYPKAPTMYLCSIYIGPKMVAVEVPAKWVTRNISFPVPNSHLTEPRTLTTVWG